MLRQSVISLLLLAMAMPGLARTRPHYGGVLRVETIDDPWKKPNGFARRLVFDGLTRIDSAGDPRPALAASWRSDDAEHRWSFLLRLGMHYHDGAPVTAAGVAAALAQTCGDHCPWGKLHPVGSQLIFTSESPMPNLPALLGGDSYLIEHASANGGVDGTGPFETKSFAAGTLTLVASDDYFAGRPFVDGIELYTRRSIHDQWIDLDAGRADIVEIPAEALRQARQQHMSVTESRPVELLVLQINAPDSSTHATLLKDINLRRAIGFAVDRSALFNVIYQKQGEITASLLPAWMTGYAFLFASDRDLNKAHQLRGGVMTAPLMLRTKDTDGALDLVAGRIALNLREAGFNVQSVAHNPKAATPAGTPDLELKLVSLDQARPAAALASLTATLDLSAPLPAQPTAELLFKTEQAMLAQATAIPLLYLPRAYATGGRVRDLHLNSDGSCALADVSITDAPRNSSSAVEVRP